MAQRGRYSDYPQVSGSGRGGGSRDVRGQTAGARGTRGAGCSRMDTHNSYEEALRQSRERMDRLQRSSRSMSDNQQSLRYADDDPRAERYLQHAEEVQRTTRLDQAGQGAPAAGAGGYTRQSRTRSGASRSYRYGGAGQEQAGRKVVRLEDAYHEQEPRGYGSVGAASGGGSYQQRGRRTGYGALQQGAGGGRWQDQGAYENESPAREDYRERQLAAHSRDSQVYRARPATFSTSAPAPAVTNAGFIARAIICLVLIVVCIFSITRIGPAMSARNEAQAEADAQQEQVTALEDTAAQLQAQLEAMDQDIAAYDSVAAQ